MGYDYATNSALNIDSTVTQSNLQDLLKSLANEDFDLVAIGRAVLADSDWFKKVTEQRYDALIPFSRSMSEFSS